MQYSNKTEYFFTPGALFSAGAVHCTIQTVDFHRSKILSVNPLLHGPWVLYMILNSRLKKMYLKAYESIGVS